MIPAYCAVDEGLKRGDKGDRVTLLQMWMSLHGKRLAIDGDFGPATEHALYTGWNAKIVTPSVARALERPMQAVIEATTRGAPMTEIAQEFIHWQAREVGGQNRGPWVRLVAKGKEGPPIKWCLFLQAWIAEQAGHPWASRISADCDVTAARAFADGRLYTGIAPNHGDLFLSWRPDMSKPTGRDHYHGGLVTSSTASTFDTIEGNSNDEGSSDGHEVCERVRSLTPRYAFVRMTDGP